MRVVWRWSECWKWCLVVRRGEEVRGAPLQRLLVAGPAPLDAAAPHPPPRHAVQSLYNSPRLPRPRTVNYIAKLLSTYRPSRALFALLVNSQELFEYPGSDQALHPVSIPSRPRRMMHVTLIAFQSDFQDLCVELDRSFCATNCPSRANLEFSRLLISFQTFPTNSILFVWIWQQFHRHHALKYSARKQTSLTVDLLFTS